MTSIWKKKWDDLLFEAQAFLFTERLSLALWCAFILGVQLLTAVYWIERYKTWLWPVGAQ